MLWPWPSPSSPMRAGSDNADITPSATLKDPQPAAPIALRTDPIATNKTPFVSSPEIFSHPPPQDPNSITLTSFLSSVSPKLPLVSFGVGLASGLYTGASRASLVFMAENAHRRPETVQGWYFYNKTKNYKVLLAGIKTGFSTGARLAAWTSLWVVAEAAAFQTRALYLGETSSSWMAYAHQNGLMRWVGHWTDGMLAGQGVALLASLAYRLPVGKLSAIGTFAGGTTGALQDLRDYLIRNQETAGVQQVPEK